MEYANHMDGGVGARTIEDKVASLRELPVSRFDVVTGFPCLRSFGKQVKRIVQLFEAEIALFFSPAVFSKGGDLPQVSFCFVG